MKEAEVIVDDKVPVVRIIREFDAPVAKVFLNVAHCASVKLTPP